MRRTLVLYAVASAIVTGALYAEQKSKPMQLLSQAIEKGKDINAVIKEHFPKDEDLIGGFKQALQDEKKHDAVQALAQHVAQLDASRVYKLYKNAMRMKEVPNLIEILRGKVAQLPTDMIKQFVAVGKKLIAHKALATPEEVFKQIRSMYGLNTSLQAALLSGEIAGKLSAAQAQSPSSA